jgi:hypothetical protein
MEKKRSENKQNFVVSTKEELANLLKRKPLRDSGMSEPLTFYDKLSIHDNAVKGSSNLSSFELQMRMLKDGGELFHRAYKGDSDAAKPLVILARNLTNELNLLAKRGYEPVSEIAKTYDEWPVVLSLIDKTKDAESWYSFFKDRLKLGEDSFCCTDRRQKIDLSNIWNRYVWFALKAMRINKVAVPLLLEKCKSLPSIQQSIPVGRTVLQTRFYELPKETVMISEWAALCPNLPAHLTNDDAVIEQFMRPLRLAVLEYWLENPSEYETAKSKVKRGATYKTDLVYRSRCFTQMEQQLRTLAGK